MFDNQGGVCAICGNKERNNRNLSVDHNHDTGKVRGLLCELCNRKLGTMEDGMFYKKALKYLEVYH